MEKPYKCVQCGAELTADEFISGGHAVPDVDGDGDVCGQYLCGPVQIDTEWATIHIASAAARIADLEAQLAAMQRIIDSYKDDIRADTPTEKEVFNSAANAWHRKAIEDSNKIITMEKELEVERMRLALCGGAADANTRTMATERINKDNPYYSSSYERVCDAVDREMDLREQLAAAQERERWIPASEAPPKNGPYLILFKGKVIYATFLTNGWYQGYYANSVVPDAWRELPAPPEEAADAE